MNATNLYVSTSRIIFSAKADDPSTWADLHGLFSGLRQSLSCTVCGELLVEPYTPTETTCQHHVCRSCKGGKKKLNPSCSWCKDYAKYVENVQLRTLLQCYKKLCLYLGCSEVYRMLVAEPAGGGDHFRRLVKEGSLFKDDFQIPTDSLSAKLILNPCKSASTQTNLDGRDERAKNDLIINGRSPTYSVICADDGNRLTIKRTEKGVNNVDKRNGKTASKDKIVRGRKRRQGRSLSRLKKGRRTGRERVDAKIHEMRKRSQDQTNVNRPRKRRPHEENLSTKVNKVRKRSVFTKPPTCKCGVQDHCKGSCRGYRCPCYSADKSCYDCGCLGCKNPRGASLNKVFCKSNWSC
ncbi:E3 ubiquitin-protein ligase MSL2 isoform X2 [Cimex lectularius]|uniref:RING-type domain-containing protein n=1 Tax=Cimex lectularius TaxID=79782 RepID=A0A8I6SK97_CIMLE|nr:E3 ubiquitin-protein ligase MSL2 isoform X2 [Cimex lectularius]